LVVFLLGAAVAAAGQRVLVDAILARVNDRIITISDFKKRFMEELGQLPSPPKTKKDVEKFARDLFRSMVEQDVLLERAKEKKLTVDDKAIDKAIQDLKARNNLTDPKAFKAALASAGLTEEMLRERYRENFLAQRVLQSEIKPTQITEEEIRARYDKEKERWRTPAKVELEQIFLPVAEDGHDREAVLERVRGIAARVRRGADLAAEATLAGVKVQDLGEIPVADLREQVRDAIEGLEPGQVSDPIPTAGGYQVVRLVKRIPAGVVPFEKVKEQIRREMSRERYRKQTEGLVKGLEKQYLVEIHQDLFDKLLRGEIGG